MRLRGGESESRKLEGQWSESRELESERLIRFRVCRRYIYIYLGHFSNLIIIGLDLGQVSLKPVPNPNPTLLFHGLVRPDPLGSGPVKPGTCGSGLICHP